jgi:succinate-semialdehyde dehydrogenase/glutarate-semialdehyde dehydrogenase
MTPENLVHHVERIEAAVAAGATLACGGEREGSLLAPTVLVDPPADDPSVCGEMFGRRIEVGTVNVNEASTVRVDLAPFAGIKDSGSGREGIRYAIREFTHERLLAFSLRPPR